MKNEHFELSNKASLLRRDFDASFAKAARDETSGLLDFLSLRVAGDTYAVSLDAVAGLYADRKVVRVPTRMRELLGVAGFRGTIAPVYDLRVLLGYGANTSHSIERAPRWLLLARGAAPVAFAFELFEAHLRIDKTAVSLSVKPDVHGPTQGAVRAADAELPLLDLGYLLQEIVRRGQVNGPSKNGEVGRI